VNPSLRLSKTLDFVRRGKVLKEQEAFKEKFGDFLPPKVDLYAALSSDNAPFRSVTEYGKNSTASFYFLDDPQDQELWQTATKTPLGNRLTFGFADDIYNNDFALEFPNNRGLEQDIITNINTQIRAHLKEISFFSQAKLACAFDLIHGESLLYIYREGDGALMEELMELSSPEYQLFEAEPNTSRQIIRVQAIKRLDYQIPMQGAFGEPQYYKVNFFEPNNNRYNYSIHPYRVVRWKANDIDYDQYRGQGTLHSCFTHLQIINEIDHAASAAARRWGVGLPAIFTKGIRSDKQAKELQQRMGNPVTNFWMQVPSENIVDIKMLGIGGGAMLNLADLEDMMIDQISAMSQIPRPILMGEVAGVVEGSEVNERQYFAALDRQHSKQNKLIREFFARDPFITNIFREYGIADYEINWGLRQVLTKLEEADLKMREYTNAVTLMNFARMKEVRAAAGLPDIEELEDFTDKDCQFLYGLNKHQLNNLFPNLGQWKQAVMSEIIETPEEREAQKQEQMQAENSNATNVERRQLSKSEKAKAELERRATKLQRRAQGTGDASIPTRAEVMDLARRAREQLVRLNLQELVPLPSEEELLRNRLEVLQGKFKKAMDSIGTYKLSERSKIRRDKLYKLEQIFEDIRREMK